MNRPVFVAGAGVISAIGLNVAECLDALEKGRTGIGHMHYFDSIHRDKIPVAEVKLSNDELAQKAGLQTVKSRTALLSCIAAKEALKCDCAIVCPGPGNVGNFRFSIGYLYVFNMYKW